MPYFLSRTRVFVLNDAMNDDMKYFKWYTASTNVAQVLLSILRHIYTNDKIMKIALYIEHGSDIWYRYYYDEHLINCNSDTHDLTSR